MLCVFCIYLRVGESDAITVKNGQAVCRQHIGDVPDDIVSFGDALMFVKRNEDGGSAARIRT